MHYEILDLLMSRYNLDNFYAFDFDEGIELVKEALEQRRKKEHWDIYLAKYPHMTEKTFISFDKFYQRQDVSKMSAKRVIEKKIDKKEYAMNAISLAEQIKNAHKKQMGSKDLQVERGQTEF